MTYSGPILSTKSSDFLDKIDDATAHLPVTDFMNDFAKRQPFRCRHKIHERCWAKQGRF